MSTLEKSGYRRLTAAWLASVAVLLLVLLLFHWYMERDEFEETAVSQAAIVGNNASAALLFGDQPAAAEVLASLAYSPNVLEAALYRDDGSLLAQFRAGRGVAAPVLGSSAATVDSGQSLREIRVVQPVMLDGRRVGTVALRVSLDRVNAELLGFFFGYGLIAAIVAGLAYVATRGLRQRIRQYRDDLEDSHARLRHMVAHRETLLEAEHKRIAMEIHDELGQILTAALMNLRLIQRVYGQDDALAAQLIVDIQSQLDAAYHGVKNIAASLHPAALQFGLVAAIESLAERVLIPAGLRWRIDATPLPPLDQGQSIALFRIAQESLTNIVRHAAAANVQIALTVVGGELILEVADDGRGLDRTPGKPTQMKFGLLGMRERAESVGAHVTIGPASAQGTCVRVVLPLVGKEMGKK